MPGIAVFFLHFLTIVIAYQLFFNFHLAGDGYGEACTGYTYSSFLNLGRYTIALLAHVMQLAGIGTVASHQAFFTALFLIISAFFSYVVFCLFYPYIQNRSAASFIILNIAALLTVINPLICQWQMFSDGLVMFGGGLFFLALALRAYRKAKFFSHIAAFCWLYLSLGAYQSNIGYYIAIGLTLMLLRNNFCFTKKSILDSMSILIVGATASIANLITIDILKKIFGMTSTIRETSISVGSILANVQYIIEDQIYRWRMGFHISPAYVVPSIIVLTLVGIFALTIIQKRALTSFIYIFLTIFGGYAAIYLPHLVSEDAWLYLAMRTLTSWFGLISSCVMILLALFPAEISASYLNFQRIFCTTMCALLCLSEWSVMQASKEQILTNIVDQQNATAIVNELLMYEATSGITVTTIKIGTDGSITAYYPFAPHVEAGGVRALAYPAYAFWCITYVTGGRTFEWQDISMDDPIYKEKFAGKDWSSFVLDEQTAFVDDTLYLMLY